MSVPAPAPAPVVAHDAGTAHVDAAATLDHGVVATRNTDGTLAGLWLYSMLGTTRTTRRTRPVGLRHTAAMHIAFAASSDAAHSIHGAYV